MNNLCSTQPINLPHKSGEEPFAFFICEIFGLAVTILMLFETICLNGDLLRASQTHVSVTFLAIAT